ncbi:AtaL-like protein [Streptomyces sp. NPDC020681]|uniref:AtaL-like protein n=1 Tax=Streptomyces sp. NPDC020681 TaxID=3365083 RepID=UPI0037961D3D
MTDIGPSDPITVCSPETARHGGEAELAVVIAIGGRDIPRAGALSHVSDYCVANDITARGHHRRRAVLADAFAYDWSPPPPSMAPSPLWAWHHPAFQVPDPQDLRLCLWVNGRLPQDGSTSDLICTVAEVTSAASEVVALEPCGVIPTATPSGVGRPRLFPPRRRCPPHHHRRPGQPGERRRRPSRVMEERIMIYVSHQLPVNAPGEPRLDRAAVWDGLVLKADNGLPFVPSMTFCQIVARHGDTVFDRDINFRGQRLTERVTLEPPHRVVFTRIAGPVLGVIVNEIEGLDDDRGSTSTP